MIIARTNWPPYTTEIAELALDDKPNRRSSKDSDTHTMRLAISIDPAIGKVPCARHKIWAFWRERLRTILSLPQGDCALG